MTESRSIFFSESQNSGSKQHGIWRDPCYPADLVGTHQRDRKIRSSDTRRVCVSHLNGVAIRFGVLYKIIPPMLAMHAPSGSPLLIIMSGSCKCCCPSVLALGITNLGTLVTGKFKNIWGFHLLSTSQH